MNTEKIVSFLRGISHLSEINVKPNKDFKHKFVDLTGQMNWVVVDDSKVAIDSHARIIFDLSEKEDRLELLSALAYQKYKSDQYDLIVAENEKFVLEHFKGDDISGYFFDA